MSFSTVVKLLVLDGLHFSHVEKMWENLNLKLVGDLQWYKKVWIYYEGVNFFVMVFSKGQNSYLIFFFVAVQYEKILFPIFKDVSQQQWECF